MQKSFLKTIFLGESPCMDIRHSIIVSVSSDSKLLPFCLQSLALQTVPKDRYEILVVCGAVGEFATSAVEGFKKKHPEHAVRYFQERTGEGVILKNFGIKEARGEILFFVESDCVVPKDWVECVANAYERNPEVVGVGMRHDVLLLTGRKGFFVRFFETLDRTPGSEIVSEEVKTNMFGFYSDPLVSTASYRKSFLSEVGGFDVNIRSLNGACQDVKFAAISRGLFLLSLPSFLTVKKGATFKRFCGEFFLYGRDLYYLSLKYPSLFNDVYKNKWKTFLTLFIYARITKPYFALLISTVLRLCGRVWAKQFEHLEAKDKPIVSREAGFEIVTQLRSSGSTEKIIKTQGKLFSKNFVPGKALKVRFSTVVIPTYNRSAALMDALEPIVNQTVNFADYEVIIVDDGSADDTREKVFGFIRAHPKSIIRYVRKQNGGPASARNFGLKEARGDIIFFTDDDSRVPSDWMEVSLNAFEQYPTAAGVGGWTVPPEEELRTSAVSRYTHFVSFFFNQFVGAAIRDHEILSNNPLMCFGTFAYNTAHVCYRKEILQKMKGFREEFFWPGSEDNDLAFRVTLAGYPLLYIPYHVVHSKNMSLIEFSKLYFRRGANGYLFRILNREAIEKLRPGFGERYGSLGSFITRFSGPERLLALLEWFSLNFGILYMKRKL